MESHVINWLVTTIVPNIAMNDYRPKCKHIVKKNDVFSMKYDGQMKQFQKAPPGEAPTL